ncbi:MAG: hypothetical protein GOU97_00490 [Nanoarchaeota archaeon]|nr:hypothetical protein [Nanoarchaeota archaeon]
MNSKGVTPVIAQIIMLLIAVAIAVSAYYFIISLQTDIETGGTASTKKIVSTSGKVLNLISIKCNASATYDVVLTVQNAGVGKIDSGYWQGVLIDQAGNDLETNQSDASEAAMTQSGFITLEFNFGSYLLAANTNTTYSVKAYSPDGAIVTGTCILQ